VEIEDFELTEMFQGKFATSKRTRNVRGFRSGAVVFAVTVALASVLGACGGSSSSSRDTSGVSLKVGVISANSSARQVNRLKSGAFDGTDYSIDWVEFASTNDAVPALISGAIDVALMVQSPDVVLAAGNATEPWTANSAPFVVIGAGLPFTDTGQILIVKTDSPVQSVADLSGRSVTFPRGALVQYCWVKLAAANNIAPGSVNEVLLPGGEGKAAYQSGAADATMGTTWAKSQVAGGKAREIAKCDSKTSPSYALSLARAGLLDDAAASAAVGDLLGRVQLADEWSNDHQEEAAKTYVDIASQSASEAAASAKYDSRNRVPLDEETIAAVQDQGVVFGELGVAKTSPDLAFLFDTRFDGGVTRGQ
jgi:sulfonate transport system substrate-binding protein